MKLEKVSALKSRYGYTWRGIRRPHDRELGIVGGELIVMDMLSNEVLAVRRGFIRSGYVERRRFRCHKVRSAPGSNSRRQDSCQPGRPRKDTDTVNVLIPLSDNWKMKV